MSKLRIGILTFRNEANDGATLAAKLNISLAVIGRHVLIDHPIDGVTGKDVWESIDESDIIMVYLSPRSGNQMMTEMDVIEALEEKYSDKIWVLNMISDKYGTDLRNNDECRARMYETPNMRSYVITTSDQYNHALTTMTDDALKFALEISNIWNMKELGVIIEHYGFVKNLENVEGDENV